MRENSFRQGMRQAFILLGQLFGKNIKRKGETLFSISRLVRRQTPSSEVTQRVTACENVPLHGQKIEATIELKYVTVINNSFEQLLSELMYFSTICNSMYATASFPFFFR